VGHEEGRDSRSAARLIIGTSSDAARHAVRQNVAERCGLPAKADGDPWQHMFATAAECRPAGETEIVPYWVFEGPAKIERHLLVQPYIREASVLPHLLSSTAMYRLAFGQPRQEELLGALGNNPYRGPTTKAYRDKDRLESALD
jgi:hypothetical protein